MIQKERIRHREVYVFMKCDVPVPLEKLRWFETKLNLDRKSPEELNPFRSLLIEQKDVFAEAFYLHLYAIPETRIYLDHEKYQGYLKKAWNNWFEFLFKEGFSDRFLNYQWQSGLRHVEIGVDHRYITLGYSYLRQFCQKTINDKIPVEDRESVLQVIDKMIDFCLLVETQAFIEATTQCDIEVVRGISHQVRNPLTVIGGNILRLKKKVTSDNPVHEIYDAILGENQRLENMVNDVIVYSEMFQKEPVFSNISLEDLMLELITKLNEKTSGANVKIDLKLSPEATYVNVDREDIYNMFLYLLENSLEAVDPKAPLIRVSSRPWPEESSFIEVEIFNTGQLPGMEDLSNLFVPFNSSKPYGTGFGLSIARLAARKNLGDLSLEPVSDKGVRCVIKLPAPPESGGEDNR